MRPFAATEIPAGPNAQTLQRAVSGQPVSRTFDRFDRTGEHGRPLRHDRSPLLCRCADPVLIAAAVALFAGSRAAEQKAPAALTTDELRQTCNRACLVEVMDPYLPKMHPIPPRVRLRNSLHIHELFWIKNGVIQHIGANPNVAFYGMRSGRDK